MFRSLLDENPGKYYPRLISPQAQPAAATKTSKNQEIFLRTEDFLMMFSIRICTYGHGPRLPVCVALMSNPKSRENLNTCVRLKGPLSYYMT